jgi:hypothetical protein
MLSRLLTKLTTTTSVPTVTHEQLQQAHLNGSCTSSTFARSTNTPVDTSLAPSIIRSRNLIRRAFRAASRSF